MSIRKDEPSHLTSPAKHVDLVVLAVYLLGGDQKAVDTEDVAIRAYELAPSRFAWRKYPSQINLELVRVSLSDAKKGDTSRLVGSGNTGWSLTPAGLSWATQHADALLAADRTQKREEGRGGSVDEQRWRRERERLLATTAWQRWTSQQSGTLREAKDVFRIDSYAVGRMRSVKVTRLTSLFKQDPEIFPFLSSMAELVETEEDPSAENKNH
jgi:hypothetical protein